MSTTEASPCPSLTLDAKTAADLMTPTIVSIPVTATVLEAVAVLKEKRISAAPVCDEFGNAVGVLSRSDIVAHDPERFEYVQPDLEQFKKDGFLVRLRHTLSQVVKPEKAKARFVKEIMTPVVFSVARETAAHCTIEAMLSLAIHRLFVTDSEGSIVGVVSATDILRHLRPTGILKEKPAEKEDDGLCL